MPKRKSEFGGSGGRDDKRESNWHEKNKDQDSTCRQASEHIETGGIFNSNSLFAKAPTAHTQQNMASQVNAMLLKGSGSSFMKSLTVSLGYK